MFRPKVSHHQAYSIVPGSVSKRAKPPGCDANRLLSPPGAEVKISGAEPPPSHMPSFCGSQEHCVGCIETRLRVGRSGVRYRSEARYFYLFQNAQVSSVVHSTSIFYDYQGLYPRGWSNRDVLSTNRLHLLSRLKSEKLKLCFPL